MINYSVSNYSQNCVLYLQNFERNLIEKIKSILANKQGLKCGLSLELASRDKDGECLIVVSNASFSISGSYESYNELNSFCRRQMPEIAKFISSDQILRVSLNFAKKEAPVTEDTPDKASTQGEVSQFTVQTPVYTFSQIILSEEIRQEISTALNVLKYQELIYKDWGFNEVDPIPKSVLNFYGPPGTGKTMSAHAVANELGKPLLALNYAEIESKYVGEAPKNLMKAFETAKREDAVLFFDEADSFLGKRIRNVTQGAEQALNSLRSQMLMLLEQHSGIIIFATNLVSNFDAAFESRILKHIKFELPNKEARIAIINRMLPSKLPVSSRFTETQLSELSEICDGFSGREIKGVILETLLDKASKFGEMSVFEFEDFKYRFERKREERKKLKEESQAELKVKIANAIAKKTASDNQDNDSHNDSTATEKQDDKAK